MQCLTRTVSRPSMAAQATRATLHANRLTVDQQLVGVTYEIDEDRRLENNSNSSSDGSNDSSSDVIGNDGNGGSGGIGNGDSGGT
uniref:Uncharacterized protein n=1 Tax=Vespula pensylvanica TaxID=30213 RepID=A0A834KU45_VESPE|nr:hypothetical protein H0235_012748 [Vespula pensylvanica]